MGISDRIEAFITELLKSEQNDYVELGRNELAGIFNCVPSQINYVLRTRFNPEQGYIVKSRRGGSGYLRIYRINTDDRLLNITKKLNSELNFDSAALIINELFSCNVLTKNEAEIMLGAVSENSIPGFLPNADAIRTNVLKNMIYSIRKD